jgi:phosphopantothenate-cysteine ligase
LIVVLLQQLETDIDILLKKAESARRKYGVHAVVANELSTRKEKVIVVTDQSQTVIEKKGVGMDVEEPLIDFLIKEHAAYTFHQSHFVAKTSEVNDSSIKS